MIKTKAKSKTKASAKRAKKTVKTSSFKVTGENLLKKVKGVIKEGNVRRIIIKDKNGKELIQFPLTIGVVGTILAPILAALGAIAALIKECTITVERE